MSTAVPTLPQDDQQLVDAMSFLLSSKEQSIQTLGGQNMTLAQQLDAAQKALAAVTADDSSLAAQLLAAQLQSALLQQLAKPGMALNLHRLPFTMDPNARPINVWFQPGNTGGTGGGSTKPHGSWSMTQNDDGSTDYAIAPASIAPSSDNFIWGLNFLKSLMALNRAIQRTVFEISDENLPKSMGVETNFEHSANSFRNNAGIQALLGKDRDAVTGLLVTNQWRWYDIGAGHWFDTGIPLDRGLFGTGKRIELISEFEEVPGVGTHNISLTINGTQYTVDKWSKTKATTWGPYLQIGFQMDALASAQPYQVKVWDMQTYWL